MFSLSSKWKHGGVGWNKTWDELAQKNSPSYIENFMGDTEQQDILYLKQLLSANVSRKKLAQCRMKNSSRGYLTTDVGYCFFYSIPE